MEEKSTKTDDNNGNDNSMAIDFQRMMLEERKRAKAERQRKKQLLKQQQQQEKDTPTQDDDHKKKEAKNKLKDEIDSLFSSLPILLQNNDDDMAPIISPAHLQSIRYSSTFLHPSYTQHLLSYLQSLPQTSYNASSSDTSSSNGKWTLLPHAQRRVLLLDDTNTNNNNNIPLPLAQIIQKISPYFPPTHQPNHVLINEYDATGGIMAHTDGPCYYPTTVTISIGGGHVLLKFTPRTTMDDQEKATDDASTHEVILKGNGSIICFANDMYTNYCHGIEEGVWMEQPNVERCLNYKEENELKEVKRGYRISLTFRHKFVASS